MRQKMVKVMTSASCLTEWSRALMIVFNPEVEYIVNKGSSRKEIQTRLE
jgi:hypothetical protein